MEWLIQVADSVNQRQAELAKAGARFQVRAARRLTLHGIRYELQLDVWPEVGFDNFAWAAFERSWTGATRSVDDVEAKVNRMLDAYALGETPPGPSFE